MTKTAHASTGSARTAFETLTSFGKESVHPELVEGSKHERFFVRSTAVFRIKAPKNYLRGSPHQEIPWEDNLMFPEVHQFSLVEIWE